MADRYEYAVHALTDRFEPNRSSFRFIVTLRLNDQGRIQLGHHHIISPAQNDLSADNPQEPRNHRSYNESFSTRPVFVIGPAGNPQEPITATVLESSDNDSESSDDDSLPSLETRYDDESSLSDDESLPPLEQG